VVNKVTQTDFGYTGQRNMDAQDNQYSLGLMDYNARFYSPYLNQFSQPDTLTPGGPQGLNRYAYVVNNPIIFTDPSGHRCVPEDECKNESETASLVIFTSDLGQTWTDTEKNILNSNAHSVATALANAINKESWISWKSGDVDEYSDISSTQAFYQIFGGSIVARRSAMSCSRCWAMHQGKLDGSHYEIWVYKNTITNTIINHPLLFTHEMGHAFDVARGVDSTGVVPNDLLRPVNGDGVIGTDANGANYGYAGPHYQWQFGRDANNRAGEEFADMFVGWVYNRWESSDLGTRRQEFMNTLW
jgi:RHS repeat-associated protein